jgi:hypothetical protein
MPGLPPPAGGNGLAGAAPPPTGGNGEPAAGWDATSDPAGGNGDCAHAAGTASNASAHAITSLMRMITAFSLKTGGRISPALCTILAGA